MAVSKLSQITPAGSPPALTDQLVGVTGGTTDNLYTVQQIADTIGSTSAITVGTTTVSGGTNGEALIDNGGVVGQAVIPTGANPSATAGPTAVNGSATTFMRSDAAPAVQTATTGQLGLVKPDGTSITISAGTISAVTRTLLTGNVTKYVNGATGSDSNDGSIGSPWATPAHALAFAGTLDCQGLYTLTIQIEDGTYTGQSLALPYVVGINPSAPPVLQGNTTTPANCILQGTGAGDQIIVNEIPGCLWRVGGFEYDMNGATALYAQNFALIYPFASNFIGSGGTGIALKAQRYGYIDGANYPLSTTPPNPGVGFYGDSIFFEFGGYMDEIVFELGLCNINLDGAPITFLTGAETSDIASFDVEGESRLGLYYCQFTTPTNLSNDDGTACFLWDKSTVDTIPLTRNQLPGQVGQTGIIDQFQNSLCTGDLLPNSYSGPYVPASGDTITLPAGSRQVLIAPAAAIATLNIVLPPFPGVGDSVTFGCGNAVAAVTFSTSDGYTLGVMPVGFAQGGSTQLTFDFTTTGIWYVGGGGHG